MEYGLLIKGPLTVQIMQCEIFVNDSMENLDDLPKKQMVSRTLLFSFLKSEARYLSPRKSTDN